MTADLPFPTSLPEFQRLFPDDAACGSSLERIRWREGFVCPWCSTPGDHRCVTGGYDVVWRVLGAS